VILGQQSLCSIWLLEIGGHFFGMRIFSIIAVIIIGLIFFKTIMLQILALLALIFVIIIGAYYLFQFLLGCIGLIVIVVGAIMALSLIIYAVTTWF